LDGFLDQVRRVGCIFKLVLDPERVADDVVQVAGMYRYDVALVAEPGFLAVADRPVVDRGRCAYSVLLPSGLGGACGGGVEVSESSFVGPVSERGLSIWPDPETGGNVPPAVRRRSSSKSGPDLAERRSWGFCDSVSDDELVSGVGFPGWFIKVIDGGSL